MIKNIKHLLNEFKKFAMRGNMIDLAVGLTVGAGFGKIVSSFVNDIIMPPIGLILGKVNFKDLYLNLSNNSYTSLAEAERAGAPVIKYGNFLNNIIDFTIVAFAIFIIVNIVNKVHKKEDNKSKPSEKKCPYCFSKINIKATRCPNCTSKLSE